MQKADKDTIKRNNKKVILNQLKFGEFSRTEIAARTGMSNSTVSALVSELIKDGLIFEKDQAMSTGGRKAIHLGINPNGTYALAIRIMRVSVTCTLVNLKLQVVAQRETPIVSAGEEALHEALDSCLGSLLKDNPEINPRITGVGVCVQGLVDYKHQTVMLSSQLKLRNTDIKPLIKAHIDRPISIIRLTDAMLIGEFILSRLKSDGNYIYLYIAESGVGLSVMWKGRVAQPSRSGLEVGHIQIEDNHIRCSCGNTGCVETVVGESAARRELQRLAPGDSKMAQLTLAETARLAANGETICLHVLTEQGRCIGKVISAMVNLFAPEVVFIGGPFCHAGPQVQQTIREYAVNGELEVYKKIPIRFTTAVDRVAFVGLADRVYRMNLLGSSF